MSHLPALPPLDAAVQMLDAAIVHDLRGMRVVALSFESVMLAGAGIRHVVAVAIDSEGERHWLGVRRVSGRRPSAAYLGLFSSLVLRGLQVDGCLLVRVERCPELVQRIRDTFGPGATFEESA